MALVAVILLTLSISLSALLAGAHPALATDKLTPTLPFRLTRRVLDPVFVVLGWSCWLGAVFMAIWPPNRHSSSSSPSSFAPLGCLLRFYLSLYLNTALPSFLLGTFASNIFGMLVLGLAYNLQHVDFIGGNVRVSCQVLQGIMDGFCGCLTTVSTWVAELNSLGLSRKRQAYVYGASSVGTGLAVLVVVMGSLLWTRGFASPVYG